jgi:hypothetical protein
MPRKRSERFGEPIALERNVLGRWSGREGVKLLTVQLVRQQMLKKA